MKKTKILMPVLAIAGLGATIAPILTITSCTQKSDEYNMMYDYSEKSYICRGVNGKINEYLTFNVKLTNDPGTEGDGAFVINIDTETQFKNFKIASFKYNQNELTYKEGLKDPTQLNDGEFCFVEGALVYKKSGLKLNDTFQIKIVLDEEIKECIASFTTHSI